MTLSTVLTVINCLGSILIAAWLALLIGAGKNSKVDAAYGALVDNNIKILALKKKKQKKSTTAGIGKLQKQSEKITSGDLSIAGILPLPGLKLAELFPQLYQTVLFTKLHDRTAELFGRKYAVYKAKCIYAEAISIAIAGSGAAMFIGTFFAADSGLTTGLITTGVLMGLSITYGYMKIDGMRTKAFKRTAAISRQFPNVVSKLALLSCSGMIMSGAWRITAHSGSGELYEEMRMTSDELMQNISPEAAYGAFITRCNTKETSKLASAILQNLSKGNDEIAELLRGMAREAWTERRSGAKVLAEKANAKLVIPTMLLFLSILVIIIVPLVMSLGSSIR